MPATSLNTISVDINASEPMRWHSMEDASRSKNLTNIGRDNIHLNINKNTNTTNNSKNLLGQYNYAVNYDVWATHEVGIPLSELANSARGQRQPYNDTTNQQSLIIPADSDVSADDLLACDFSKLFRDDTTPTQSNYCGNSGDGEAEEFKINNILSNDNKKLSFNRDVETVVVDIENTDKCSGCNDSDIKNGDENRDEREKNNDAAVKSGHCDLSIDRNDDTQ